MRKILIALLFVFMISLGCVSAAEDTNQTVGDDTCDIDTLTVSEDNDEISAKDAGTFTALQEKIDNAPAGSTINLGNDYRRNDDSDPNKITINKALTINGNGHKIDVDGSYYAQSRIFYITSSNVVLNDINFLDAYSSGHYSEPGHYNGGAIYSNGNLKINNCNFSNCYVHEAYGSAIYCEASVELNNCIFTNNTGYAVSGYGRPNTVEAKNAKIHNSRFTDNVLPVSVSGNLEVLNSIFINNDGALGGGTKNTIKGSTFTNNSYTFNQASGGAIAASSNTEIENCTFDSNEAYYGGALSLGGNNTVVSNCLFKNNHAEFGGAIDLFDNSEVVLINSKFIQNSATGGGAISISGINHVLHSLNFVNNSAAYGGALCYYNSINTIVNLCNFSKNSASAYGGAIGDFDYAFNYIQNSYFANNSCWRGEMIDFSTSLGLIYKDINIASKISNITFEQNVSNLYSNGISLKDNNLTVHGYHNGHFLSGNIVVEIAGKTFEKALDSRGYASFDLNGLSGGIHEATIYCTGESGASSSQTTLPIPIESSIRLNVPDVTKNYGGSERLQITLTDGGKPVINAGINININGVDYSKTTNSNGKASLALNLNAGTYNATVSYGDISTTAKVTVKKLSTKTALTYEKTSHNSVVLTASITPSTAGGKVNFNVNGKDYTATVKDSQATVNLKNLDVGSYKVKATYKGDTNHKSSSSSNVNFNIEEYSIIVSAPSVTKFYGGSERFVVTITDNANKPVVNASVKISINGQSYDKTTNSNGKTSIPLNLNSGKYTVSTEFDGSRTRSTVTVKDTVVADDFTKIYRNGTQYRGTFVDSQGNLLKNTEVRLNINGVYYYKTTKDNGVAIMNINLNPGTYILTADNPSSGEMHTTKIIVLPSIVENKDVTMYYKNGSQYKVRILGPDGKPVGAGVKVTFNINGVFYERNTSAEGYAKLNLKLNPDTYIVTAEYNGLRASNTVIIKSVLSANDLNMKYGSGSQFKVKLLNGQGKPYANQTIIFNINGVFYERVTHDDGVARLNIKLMAGEYIITSSYNGLNIANKVTISS